MNLSHPMKRYHIFFQTVKTNSIDFDLTLLLLEQLKIKKFPAVKIEGIARGL